MIKKIKQIYVENNIARRTSDLTDQKDEDPYNEK